jgi:hypothetical protein
MFFIAVENSMYKAASRDSRHKHDCIEEAVLAIIPVVKALAGVKRFTGLYGSSSTENY